MVQYSLIDSYNNFLDKKIHYPFVKKRELKPRARIPGIEHEWQNSFLVIFVEETIPHVHKKYIRFFDQNRTTKTNLFRYDLIPQLKQFDRDQKNLESAHFIDFLRALLPVDYALLIQRDPATKTKNRYSLSHFHVRIDWPIADAAEDLARYLRYISKDLYEKGDKYIEQIQKKFFEYYCLPIMVGGRRTAAIVAAQFLKRLGCIATVYAGSSESRALIRISERGVSKLILVKIKDSEMDQVIKENYLTPSTFQKYYVLARQNKYGICIFQATYAYTNQARPPDDGKLREIRPDLNWLSVGGQHIIPKPGVWEYPPLPLNFIYT
jgi:hypothetical protein